MRERDVADTSSWEPWQHDYRFGVVLVMPPPQVASPIDALRQAYDQNIPLTAASPAHKDLAVHIARMGRWKDASDEYLTRALARATRTRLRIVFEPQATR